MKTDDINEVSMNFELFDEMFKSCSSQEWFTSFYNHGWKPFKDGKRILVDRNYTVNFCLQQTLIEESLKGGTIKKFYKIVRGGRPPTRYGPNSRPEDKKRLKEKTPTFEAMITPAVTSRQNQVRNIKRDMNLKKQEAKFENGLSGTDTSSLEISDKTEITMKFLSFHQALAWSKDHPGRIITRSPDGAGYIIKNEK